MTPGGEELAFRYRIVLDGNLTDLGTALGRKGWAGADRLRLGKAQLRYDAVHEARVEGRRLVLVLDPRVPLDRRLRKKLCAGSALVLEVRGLDPREIAGRCSARRPPLDARRAQVGEENRGEYFRSVECPGCGAGLELSELDEAPYTYCDYCASIFGGEGKLVADGHKFAICDGCGLFDRSRSYTEQYFYFLLVVVGFRRKRRRLCDACAAGLFWKTLMLNLPFVIGLPGALAIALQSLRERSAMTRLLARANAQVRRGRPDAVAALYQEIYARLCEHPGLLFNEAVACANAGDRVGCLARLERLRKVCSNYEPAERLQRQLAERAAKGS